MFDIGFLELVLVTIVGLLVLGPERLPVAARTVGLYLGKLRRSFNNVRAEIERELNTDEIRQDLHNQAIMEQLRDAERDLKKGLTGDDGFAEHDDRSHTDAAEPEPDDRSHADAAEPEPDDSSHADAAEPEPDDRSHADAAEPETDDRSHADAAEPEPDDRSHADAAEPEPDDRSHADAAETEPPKP
jgi:sec-independent protein translocase protein TatB